jgi:hypothetical protein
MNGTSENRSASNRQNGSASLEKHREEKKLENLDATAKLHPSWQAKKQMEDKLKKLKFEGKKMTFNDED